MDLSKIENDLISEIKLTPLQAKIFLFITVEGKQTIKQISEKFNLTESEALEIGNSLIKL